MNTHFFRILLSAIISQMALTCFGQIQNKEFIYNRQSDKIYFNKIENVVHIGFVEGTDVGTRHELLEDLSNIANYTMFPDSSYRLIIKQGRSAFFKEKALKNNAVTYCQNEYRESDDGIVWSTNRILIKMKESLPIRTLLDSLNVPDIQYESKWYDSTIFALTIPKNRNLFTLSNQIFESELVEFSQPSFFCYATLDGYDTNPEFGEQWNIRDTTMFDTGDTSLCRLGINAVRAWRFTTGNSDIKIAVLDNGVEDAHEDLADNFLIEKNYTGIELSNMRNAKMHGTACAGIIAAANNNVGIVGIAHNCKIASFITHCKIDTINLNNKSGINPPGNNTDTDYYCDELVADAIYYACDSIHTDVFSCSWHRNVSVKEILKSAIDHATQNGRNGKGCVFVFSSGNNYGPNSSIKPTAILPNVLSVGATSATGYRASWDAPEGEMVSYSWESCFGDSLDLMAPGEMVWTTCNASNSCYDGEFDGTSAAAPHVAGVAALVLSIDTNLTYRQVFEILCSSATKVRSEYYSYSHNPSYPYGTWNNEMGYGLVNAHHAILKTLYRDYYITGTSEIGLCETGSYHIHGTTPFNDSITNCWTSSPNIEILSTNDSVIARGTYPGEGWLAFNIIHDNDSLPLLFPVTVTNGQISILANHEITSNTALSTPYFTDSDIIIDSLATLTITDTLFIAGGSRIIVRPGGKLIVNGGTLANACDGEMWEGIIVEGDSTQRQQPNKQGAVYLTNATIENAFNAVSTRGAENNDAQWAKTGGIVQATNTLGSYDITLDNCASTPTPRTPPSRWNPTAPSAKSPSTT